MRNNEQHSGRHGLRDDHQLHDVRVRRERRRSERERSRDEREPEHQVAALLAEPEAVDETVDHRDPAGKRRERGGLRRERGAAEALGQAPAGNRRGHGHRRADAESEGEGAAQQELLTLAQSCLRDEHRQTGADPR
jgi:hypothetical protein